MDRVIDPELHIGRAAAMVALAWLVAVVAAAQSGWLAALAPPLIAVLVAAGIALPTLAYFLVPGVRALADRIGHRPILIMHVWRVPAALLFFGYGLAGALPPLFWILAGTGDLIAGALAAWQATRPASIAGYRRFHRFGLADFVVAVGTGLAYTLLGDPRMAPVATLPLALVPLFGVGISGASHIIAFDMLRRGSGMPAAT